MIIYTRTLTVLEMKIYWSKSNSWIYYTPAPRRGRVYTVLPLSVCLFVLPSIQDIFHRIFLSNYWWQKSDIRSQASYRYAILWDTFLDPSDSYFLFADLVGFYTHWTYMLIFRRIFLSNYWWQKSDIRSQASYRYPILWEAFFDPSDSYFLFAKERGYHRWALAHSSSCFYIVLNKNWKITGPNKVLLLLGRRIGADREDITYAQI